METLDTELEEFKKQNHSQIDKVKERHKQVHAAWQHINTLKNEKERNLEGKYSCKLIRNQYPNTLF